MALDNLISVIFSDENVAKIAEAIKAIRTELAGKTVNLSPQERQQYGRIADTNKVFVDKCKDYMELNPETIPRALDKAEFDRDYAARKQMEAPIRDLLQVVEQMQDTKTLLDHDNYTAAISYYRYVKFLAGSNEPGTTSIYEDLRKHFKNSPSAQPSGGESAQPAAEAR